MRLHRLLELPDWTASRLADETRRHLPRGSQTDPSTISRLSRSDTFKGERQQLRTASLALALAIEAATGGLVRAEELPITARTRATLKTLRTSQANQSPPEAAAPEAAA